jgi:hypothetical protein
LTWCGPDVKLAAQVHRRAGRARKNNSVEDVCHVDACLRNMPTVGRAPCGWAWAISTAAIDATNRVRALSNIAPVATPPAGTNITDLVIEERRRQLFSEGHRYVDMLRKKIPFQTGMNRKGQTYSTLTCVPLPDVETRNNPNFKG